MLSRFAVAASLAPLNELRINKALRPPYTCKYEFVSPWDKRHPLTCTTRPRCSMHSRAYVAYERLAGFRDLPDSYKGAEVLRACDGLHRLARRSRAPPVQPPVAAIVAQPSLCDATSCCAVQVLNVSQVSHPMTPSRDFSRLGQTM